MGTARVRVKKKCLQLSMKTRSRRMSRRGGGSWTDWMFGRKQDSGPAKTSSWFGSSKDKYCIPVKKDLVQFLVTEFKKLKDRTSSELNGPELTNDVNEYVKRYLESKKYNYTGMCVGTGTSPFNARFPIQSVSFESVAKQVREGVITGAGDEDVLRKRAETKRAEDSKLRSEASYQRWAEQNARFEGGKKRKRTRKVSREKNVFI